MTYKFGNQETTVVGGLTAAEAAAGWRILHVPDWRTPSADAASFANVTIGNNQDANGLNINTKAWSFGGSGGGDRDFIVSGDAGSFMWLPDGSINTARIRFMWGQVAGATGNQDVVWIFGAIQSGDDGSGNQVLTIDDTGTKDVRATSAALEEPAVRYGYHTTTIDLTLTSWAQLPTMFYLGRDRTNTTGDDMNNAAIVYGIQVLVK